MCRCFVWKAIVNLCGRAVAVKQETWRRAAILECGGLTPLSSRLSGSLLRNQRQRQAAALQKLDWVSLSRILARVASDHTKDMTAYARLYADEFGESHFEDIEMDPTLTDYTPPAPPLSLSAFLPASQVGFMNAPAGWVSDWHPSSGRTIFVVLSREWEVTASDGEARRFPIGGVLMVEDTIGKGHSSRVVSEVDSLAAMVQLDGV
jgi:hypothetical protein